MPFFYRILFDFKCRFVLPSFCPKLNFSAKISNFQHFSFQAKNKRKGAENPDFIKVFSSFISFLFVFTFPFKSAYIHHSKCVCLNGHVGSNPTFSATSRRILWVRRFRLKTASLCGLPLLFPKKLCFSGCPA